MKKLIFITLTFLMISGLCGPSFAQKGEVKEKKAEGVQMDVLIETFFTKRTGDLPEMLKLHQIRVLVVPSRSTYFLDKAGQPRGIDYELLKGWEKMLNKGRKKGTPRFRFSSSRLLWKNSAMPFWRGGAILPVLHLLHRAVQTNLPMQRRFLRTSARLSSPPETVRLSPLLKIYPEKKSMSSAAAHNWKI